MMRRFWRVLSEATRRYFAAGLLAFAPLAITMWVLVWIVKRLDNLLLPWVMGLFAPGLESPPQAPPLVGALFTFLVILLAGVIVRHLFGHELVNIGERILSRVPVARSIYGGVKQLFEAIFASSRHSNFNRVVLIEYPRKGIYALAFTTGSAEGPVHDALPGDRLVNCFLPTTPNPTSGFYLVLPEEDLLEVDLSVEEAFKVIMSAGLVTPKGTTTSEGAESPAAVSETGPAGAARQPG